MEFTMKLSPQSSSGKGQFTKGFLEWEMATRPEVQAALEEHALEIAAEAELRLAAVRADPEYTGQYKSYIKAEATKTHGRKVDRLVILADDRDDFAAGQIEHDHEILHGAAKVPKKGKSRRRKKR